MPRSLSDLTPIDRGKARQATGRLLATACLAVALAGPLLLGGCASQLPQQQMATLSANLPTHRELTDVPFFPQKEYQCGPAALATVLNQYHHNVTPEQLAPQIYIPERKGSLQIEMKVAARRAGLLALDAPRDLDGLLAEVAAGRPVIVLQNLGLPVLPEWHYAVVVGYDLDKQVLVLRSGTDKRRVTSFGLFERTWARSDHWGLLLLPPTELPVHGDPLALVQAADDLAATSPAGSRQALDAASRRWPDNYLVAMAQGNAAFAANDTGVASQAFRRALRARPDAGDAWNNLAYSLEAEGCGGQALTAVHCAVELAPDNADFQDSLNELTLKPGAKDATCPALPRCPISEQPSAPK